MKRKVVSCIKNVIPQRVFQWLKHQYLIIQDQKYFNQLKRDSKDFKWQALLRCPRARLDAGAIQVGHELFLFGGFNNDGEGIFVADIFDLKKNKWTKTFDLPKTMAQTHHGICSDGQRFIYIAVGQFGNNCRPATKTCFVYDVKLNQWLSLPDLPKARYAPAMQLWNGRLHVMGGSCEDRNTPSLDHWSLAVDQGKVLESSWRTEINLPRGGTHRASAIFNGELYLLGGQEGDWVAIPGDPEFLCTPLLTKETVYPDVYKLKNLNSSWQKCSSMPIKVSHTEFSTIHLNGKVILFGGSVDKDHQTHRITLTDVVQQYDFLNDRWEIIGHLPYRTKSTAVAYYDGWVYISTGQKDKSIDDPSPDEFDARTWRARLS